MNRKVRGGIYLMIDPTWDLTVLFPVLQKAIDGGVGIFQISNHWNEDQDKHFTINVICDIAHAHNIPVFINEDWTLMLNTPLDGIHFDSPPENLNIMRDFISRPFLCGMTCGNNLERVHWAANNGLDYISFCSMFPSATAGACEIVRPETIKQARLMTDMPIFAAGGISQENISALLEMGIDGIAVFSAIMHSEDPKTATHKFKNALKNYHYEKSTD